MKAMVKDKESNKQVIIYDDVDSVKDTFNDNGILAYEIRMTDGSTATFNKIDYVVYISAWVRA